MRMIVKQTGFNEDLTAQMPSDLQPSMGGRDSLDAQCAVSKETRVDQASSQSKQLPPSRSHANQSPIRAR